LNNIKGLIKAQELKKIQTLKQLSGLPTGTNSAGQGFDIKLNPIHIEKPKSKFKISNTAETIKVSPSPFGKGSKTKESYLKLKGYNYLNSQAALKKATIFKKTSSLVTTRPMPSRDKRKNSFFPYLINNLNHISLSPVIGLKNGLLLKYQKVISYTYNSSNANTLLPFAFGLSFYSDFYKNKNKEKEKAQEGAQSRQVLSYKGEVKETYELLYYFFKSIYCLISKPVFLHSADKVIIQLFYYLSIPKKKVFKFFSIMYIKGFKNKWLKKKSQATSLRKNNKITSLKSTMVNPVNRFNRKVKMSKNKLFIKWRVLKSISRLRSHNTKIRSLLFNLRKFNISKVFNRKFYLLCQILSRKFNKAVEFQLIRLHHPYHDSNILINLLSLNIRNKTKNARVAINKIYAKNQIKKINDPNLSAGKAKKGNTIKIIPAFLSGIYVKIAGRLMREPIIPRITTKVYERGASSTGKVNYLDVATITKKNRKGAYTIKIKSGQNFFPLTSAFTHPPLAGETQKAEAKAR